MAITVLFIQGAGDMHDSEGSIHLARYLERELGGEYRVIAPEMPDAEENPRYEPWRAAIEQELAGIDGPVVIVGHSFGGTVALKMLSEPPAPPAVRALFLASMPWWGPEGWDFAEYAPAEDFPARLPEIPVFLYHSVDDPHVPVEHLKPYEAQLRDARVRRVPGADHSFLRGLPELIEDIKGCESTIKALTRREENRKNLAETNKRDAEA